MASNTASPADALIKAADRAGEKTAKSSMDKTFQNFQLPEDPSALGKMYGEAAGSLYDSLDVGGSLSRSNDVAAASGVAAAASMFENRVKGEELSKTPVSELDAEIERLSNQRWGILPAVLGRSDIIDYGAKLKIASRAEQLMDTEIQRIGDTRDRIVKAAEGRAKDRVDELKAQAALLDKQSDAAKNDLSSRIDLFKAGQGTFDDIVSAALELRKINDAKKSAAGEGNSMIGLSTSQYSAEEIAAFGYFEKFGDWPVTDSSKLQLKTKLTARYSQWVQSGRPGSQLRVPAKPLPAGVSGPLPAPGSIDVSETFAVPSAANDSNAANKLKGLLGL